MIKRPLPERLWRLVSVNFGTKVISVAIAIVMWAVVLGSRNVEITKEIPVEIVTPADIVPANDIPDKIAFRLAGPKAFLRGILDRKEEPIRVNLSGAKPALVTYRFFSDNIRLPIGVKVLSINPAAILVKLEYVKRREVPVRIELKGSPPDGYRIIKAEMRPEMVRIRGAESRVDALTELVTMPIDVTKLRGNLDREVSLDLARHGVQLDGPPPRAWIELEPVMANYRVKNVDVRVLSPHRIRMEEKTITVLVRATHQDLEALDRRQVFGLIDLTGRPKGRYNEAVKVTLPDHIGLLKAIPDHLNVTLY